LREPRALVPVEIEDQRIAVLRIKRRLAVERAGRSAERRVERREFGGERIIGSGIAVVEPGLCRLAGND